MKWVLPLILLIVAEAIADIFAKTWQAHRIWYFAFFALLSYMIANSFWLFALRDGVGLARGGIIFSVCSALLAIGIGALMYQEKLSHIQMFGCVFGVMALVCIFWD